MKKILIVEDEKPLREALAIKLNDEGYEVLEATNGQTGLEVALEKKPDLILLDLIMPIMSGNEFLDELRNDDWGKTAQVIVLTNLSESEEVRNAVENKADFFVKSDWKLEDIATLIKNKFN